MKSKKALAIVLAIAMLFGVVSMASAASSLAPKGFADSQDSKQADAIAYLKAFGVLRGDAGTNNVRPGDALTREEFVTIVVRATGYETLANGLSGFKPNFTDAASISDWAVGAVNFATGQGWIKGYEDGTFRPKGNLTMAEAITVLVRATGHELNVPSTAVWPVGHILQAQHRGISTGVTVNANAPITREDMARLTYNSLFVDTAYVGDDGKVKNDGDRLAEAYLVEGTVVSVSPADEKITIDHGQQTEFPMAKEVALFGANSFSGLNGLTVRATLNANGEVVAIQVDASLGAGVYTVKSVDTKDGKRNLVMTDGTVIKLRYGAVAAEQTKVTVNGLELTRAGGEINDDASLATELAKDSNFTAGTEVVVQVADGFATSVSAVTVNNFDNLVEANALNTTDKQLTVWKYNRGNKAGAATTLKYDDSTKVVVNGDPASITDIKADDIVDYAANDTHFLKIVVTRNVVDGEFDSRTAKLVGNDEYKAVVTVKQSDGTKVAVTWSYSGTFNNNPVQDEAVNGVYENVMKSGHGRIVLNRNGEAVTVLAPKSSSAFAKLTGIYGGGKAEFDMNGTKLTLDYANPITFAHTDVNKLFAITYTLSNLNASEAVTYEGKEAEVKAILGNVIVFELDGETEAMAPDAVYEWASGDLPNAVSGAQLSVSDLAVGDKIAVSDNHKVILKK